ncbi:hypothetical protein Tco_1253752 [Tanacetum coccineum]
MGDEHLDTVPATESDEFIKSSVEILIPIPSEPEGVHKMYDVPLCENTTPLNALNEHSEIVVNFNDDNSLSDDDSSYGDNIDYVDASPPDVEIVSLEVVEIIVPEVGRIDDDILFNNPQDDTRREYLSDLYHEEFADELAHIMSLPNLECFKFKIEPDPGDLASIDPGIRSLLPLPVFCVLWFIVQDCPDCDDSRARGFVLRSLELHILSFILGIQYPNLID